MHTRHNLILNQFPARFHPNIETLLTQKQLNMSKHDIHKSNDHYIQIINNWAYLWLQEVYKSLSHQSLIGFLLNILWDTLWDWQVLVTCGHFEVVSEAGTLMNWDFNSDRQTSAVSVNSLRQTEDGATVALFLDQQSQSNQRHESLRCRKRVVYLNTTDPRALCKSIFWRPVSLDLSSWLSNELSGDLIEGTCLGLFRKWLISLNHFRNKPRQGPYTTLVFLV